MTLSLDVMLVSIHCQTRWISTSSSCSIDHFHFHLKMTYGRSSWIFIIVFIIKSISKKLLIKIWLTLHLTCMEMVLVCSLGDPVQITRNHLRMSFVCPSKYPFAPLLLLSMVYIWVQQNPTGLEGHFMLFTLSIIHQKWWWS